jgi:hypothetical protein
VLIFVTDLISGCEVINASPNYDTMSYKVTVFLILSLEGTMNSSFNYQLPSLTCKWTDTEKSCRSQAGAIRSVEFVEQLIEM